MIGLKISCDCFLIGLFMGPIRNNHVTQSIMRFALWLYFKYIIELYRNYSMYNIFNNISDITYNIYHNIIAQFLKKVISECPSNDFRHHDLQFITVIVMLIDSVTFLYVFVSNYIILVSSIMFRSYEH